MKFGSNIVFIMVAICIGTVAAQVAEWDCSTTTGVFKRSTDCTISSQIVVTGKLNVTGIPDAQGNLPKIIGGGSNRLFKVESGGELVVKSLNLTGGVASGSGQDGYGGIIFNKGRFEARHSTFTDSYGKYGGVSLTVNGGKTYFYHSTLANNEAAKNGGAVYPQGPSTIFFAFNTTFKNNEAKEDYGGGFFLFFWVGGNFFGGKTFLVGSCLPCPVLPVLPHLALHCQSCFALPCLPCPPSSRPVVC